MSDARLLRFADIVPQPWKNGGGTTVEIATRTERAGMDDFVWRVSVADVAQEGPFSSFPGVDRVLTVIDGGLELHAEGRAPVLLSAGGAPFAFPGDSPVHGRPIDGPARDINVMVRRGVCRGRVILVAPGMAWPAGAEHEVIVIALAPGEVTLAATPIALSRLDALVLAGEPLPQDVRCAMPVLHCAFARA